MATVYSDQYAAFRSGRRQAPNVFQGKVRVIYWDFASLAAGNIGDVLVCGILRAGERVIAMAEAHTTAAGTHSYGTYALASDGVSLGAVDSATRFSSALAAAAGNNQMANDIATGLGYVAATDQIIGLLNGTAAFTTGGRITGRALVVGD